MIIQDDRTAEQKLTHTVFVIGTDRGMSGWGKAEGGVSYAAWACTAEDWHECLKWVRGRGDMLRVRLAGRDWRPKGKGHTHIYVWKRKDHQY